MYVRTHPNISMNALHRIDELTWHYVPPQIKAVIERGSWWKLVLIYGALLAVSVYRFAVVKRSIFFHAAPTSYAEELESTTQLTELLVHLAFFCIPMVLAFSFSRDERR